MLETLFRHLDMVRLSVGALLMVAAAGCVGLIDGGKDGLTDQERDARAKFESKALPVLNLSCASCHGNDTKGVPFMKGMDAVAIRAQMKAYDPPVVNTEQPEISRILTKGQHDGPQLGPGPTGDLLEWLQAEQDSAKHDPDNPIITLATKPFTIMECTAGLPGDATCPTNHVSVDGIGSPPVALPGAEITFTAQKLTSGVYITNLKFAGGTSGAYIEHPLFASLPKGMDPIPDAIDRFFDLKLNEMANGSEQLGGGTAQFVGFSITDPMSVSFKAIAAFKADAKPKPKTGCKDIAKFKMQVVAAVQGACFSCHGGANANAKSTMDLSTVGSNDDAQVLLACNAMRSRTDLVNTAMSAIYLAPQPGNNTNHPFKFANAGAFTTYQNSVDVWVQAEKTAP